MAANNGSASRPTPPSNDTAESKATTSAKTPRGLWSSLLKSGARQHAAHAPASSRAPQLTSPDGGAQSPPQPQRPVPGATEVASGQLQAPEYLQSVETMKAENLEALVGSAELPYTESVKYGVKTKSVAKCQNKYVCEKTGKEILLVLGLYGA